MDDRLLEVYEQAASGDLDGARALLASLDAPPQDRVEMEAFLDSFDSDEVETVEALDTGLTGPSMYAPVEFTVRPDVVPFQCLHCSGEVHTQRHVLLNSILFSFLGWDEVDAGARVVVCAECGHCAWFTPAMPGALQAMADPDDPRRAIRGEGNKPCTVCGFQESVNGEAQLNTRGLTFLGLDWLNRSARTQTCVRCGYIHWSRMDTDPWGKALEAPPGACRACGGMDASERQVLLNSRLATHLGFDWLNEGARLRECPCGALDWFAQPAISSKQPGSVPRHE